MKHEDEKKSQKLWEQEPDGPEPTPVLIEIFDEVQKACFDTLEILENRNYKSFSWNRDSAEQIETLVKVLFENGIIGTVLLGHGLKIVDDEDFKE